MYYLGIDLGGTNIAVGLVDENLKIVFKDSVPTGASRPIDAIMDDMAALCISVVERAGVSFSEVKSAGIAAPGSIDPAKGYVCYANNINLTNYPMANELIKRTPLTKVFLENDANAAALAEARAGAGKGAKDVIMITLGTGVGGGIVIDGKLYSGFSYCGAELGHTVIEMGGRACSCGRKGCFEAYSSATGLINMTKDEMQANKETSMWKMVDGDLSKVSGRTAFNAAKEGDKAGQKVVDEYIKYLACGLANMINIFDPEVLCIGGGVCNEGDNLLIPLKKEIWKEVYGADTKTKFTEIKIAELGNDAGIIGAAVLGI
ncbi:MAG: ROK family protein [Clostridia bacterium]|nr:ROK family protein [Clostridia bacterium]